MSHADANMTPAERTIREWVSRNCDPDPYGTAEQFRRANEAFGLAWEKFRRAWFYEPR